MMLIPRLHAYTVGLSDNLLQDGSVIAEPPLDADDELCIFSRGSPWTTHGLNASYIEMPSWRRTRKQACKSEPR
jgi:hypothetical protein